VNSRLARRKQYQAVASKSKKGARALARFNAEISKQVEAA
jgi:hypothetical protein